MRDFIIRTVTAVGIAMFPLLLLQGRLVRQRTPRLPPARQDCTGSVVTAGEPMRVLVLGESTAAGVGVQSHRHGLAGYVAQFLNGHLGRSVSWQVIGKIGATAKTVAREMLDPLKDPVDVVVVALGVNDTLRFTSSRRWSHNLCELVGAVRAHVGPATVMFSPVPPLGKFRLLPQPLRAVLGMRAASLDRAARTLAQELDDVHYVPIPFGDDDRTLCEDRFHPSERGYKVWGERMALAIAARFRGQRDFSADDAALCFRSDS